MFHRCVCALARHVFFDLPIVRRVTVAGPPTLQYGVLSVGRNAMRFFPALRAMLVNWIKRSRASHGQRALLPFWGD